MADVRTLAECRASFLQLSDPMPDGRQEEVDRLREELDRCTDVMCRQAGDIVVLRDAVVRLQGELAEMTARWREERSCRTTGGARLRINEVEWTNEALGTPEPGAAGAV